MLSHEKTKKQKYFRLFCISRKFYLDSVFIKEMAKLLLSFFFPPKAKVFFGVNLAELELIIETRLASNIIMEGEKNF